MGNNQLRLQAIDAPRCRQLSDLINAKLDPIEATRLGRQGQALSDPERLRLLTLLGEAGEVCVSDACLITEREQSGVSRHLRILWEAGLADKGKRGKNLYYRPTSSGERLLAALLDRS